MQPPKRLLDYFKPDHYALSLNLEREKRMFSGHVAIQGQKRSDDGEIRLHAKQLTISSVAIDDSVVPFTQEQDECVITTHFPAGEYRIEIVFNGTITDAMHGLYPCYFEVDGKKKELLATQFESHHAREVFPCIDEPEAKATFDLTLETEANVTVLSNTPQAKRTITDEGRWKTQFETTPRMSTYLLAFVVGELQKQTTRTVRGVEINIYATKAHAPANLTYSLDWARKNIEFFEDYFDTPYPLSKCDHVALPDFSAGAMENWGLIAYREAALLVDETQATLETKQQVSTVISHEISHQWFGNLVTMKWWDDLWLNESFANLMEYIACDALEPNWHIWEQFSISECLTALRRDALEGVQPVKVSVEDPGEINALFDHAIVYAKGSRLLRMLHDYIGPDAFRAGLKKYFETHQYTNTTGNDLWHALGDVSGKDVADFMKPWLTEPGYPLVISENNALSQERFFLGSHDKHSTLWNIPLLASSSSFPALLSQQHMAVDNGNNIMLNMSDAANFITQYDISQLRRIIRTIEQNGLEPIDIIRLLNEQLMLMLAGYSDCRTLMPVLKSIRRSTNPNVWRAALLAFEPLKLLVENDEKNAPKLRKAVRELVTEQFVRLGWKPMAHEDEQNTKLRTTILTFIEFAGDEKLTRSARATYASAPFSDLDPTTRVPILRMIVREGIDDQVFDDLLSLYKNTPSPEIQKDLAQVLTATRTQAQIDHLLTSLTDGTIRPQDLRRWLPYLLSSTDAREKSWHWMQNNWSWIVKTFEGDMSFDNFPKFAGHFLVSAQHLDEYRKFFETWRAYPALTRAINLGEKELEATVDFINRNQPLLSSVFEEGGTL